MDISSSWIVHSKVTDSRKSGRAHGSVLPPRGTAAARPECALTAAHDARSGSPRGDHEWARRGGVLKALGMAPLARLRAAGAA